MNQSLQAIGWILLTGVLEISIATLARVLSADFHAFQLVFFYNALALVFFLPSFLLRGVTTLKTSRLPLYGLRTVMEFVAFSISFYCLTRMPLAVHTVMGFLSPLFGSIVAILFLKEKNHSYRWLALGGGFLGVLVATRPGVTEFGYSALIMIVAAMCFAVSGACIKKLTATEPPQRIAFYMVFLTSLLALPFALFVWNMPELRHLPYLLLLGVMVAGVQYAVSQAFAKGEVTLILPFFFLNIVWAPILAYFVFGERVDLWTVLGGGMIIASALYATYRSRGTDRLDGYAIEATTGI